MKMKMDGGDLKNILEAANACREEGVLLLKSNKWLLKTISAEQALMFNARVTKKAMDNYDREGAETMGLEYNSILKSISSSTDPVEIDAELGSGSHKLNVKQGGYNAGLTLVNTDYVEGVASGVPDIEWPVEVEGDVDFLQQFISRADDIVDEDYFFVSPREDGLYLYCEKDSQDLVMRKAWSDFGSSNVDWSKGNRSDKAGGNDLDPEKHKGCDAVFSMDWAKSIKYIENEAKFRFGNHVPTHIVFNTGDGIDASYFLSPRFQIENEYWTVSDDDLGR